MQTEKLSGLAETAILVLQDFLVESYDVFEGLVGELFQAGPCRL